MKKLTRRLARKFPWELIVLIVGACLTRLIGLSSPKGTVFDEVYFKSFAASYFNHSYYFDIHPPLGKLMLAGWAWLVHASPNQFVPGTATSLRLFVAIFGVMVVPLVYGITHRLSKSRLAAFLAGFMVMLNGAFIVESRFVLVDSILVVMGLAALYSIIRWREDRSNLWLVLAGLFSGGAASIKWTGLTALFLVMVVICATLFKKRKDVGKLLVKLGAVLGLAILIYLGSFYIHFQMLNHSGPGDAFMPIKFQQTLVGNPNYDPSVHLSFWTKLVETNKEMYRANATLTATDYYSSKWYTWPFETRPIYYWEGKPQANGNYGNIYMFGDPIIWWATSASVLVALYLICIPSFRRKHKKHLKLIYFLLLAFFVNWLPFAKISRVMFLYHYLFASIFSTILLAVLIALLLPDAKNIKKSPRMIASGIIILLTLVGFFYFAPLTYGWAVSPQTLSHLSWIRDWF